MQMVHLRQPNQRPSQPDQLEGRIFPPFKLAQMMQAAESKTDATYPEDDMGRAAQEHQRACQ